MECVSLSCKSRTSANHEEGRFSVRLYTKIDLAMKNGVFLPALLSTKHYVERHAWSLSASLSFSKMWS